MYKILQESKNFVNYYAIFISRESSVVFGEYLSSKEWRNNYGIRIIDAEFQEDLSCILIPNNLDYKLFEAELFTFKRTHKNKFVKNSQFWGQENVGYENKHWTFNV
jgi:hypothetical protein